MKKLVNPLMSITFEGNEFVSNAIVAFKNEKLMEKLKSNAEKYYKEPSYSVMDRKIRAASGDPRDYSSFGPYWWPNPDTKDGLPYIRKDGITNPTSRDKIGFIFNKVYYLALAAYYFDDMKYARKAVEDIKVWCVDEETKMNPSLNYSQAIPGICDGRGIGLIETAGSYKLLEGIQLLCAMGEMPSDVLDGFKKWLNEFLNWMITSEIGLDEALQHNNHGSWYDVQVATSAIFLGRMNLARKVISDSYFIRTERHISPDGKQKFELERTNGLGYSTMNLDALLILANISRKYKIKASGRGTTEIYNMKREDGSIAIKKAIDYLSPFGKSLEGFEYTQINGKTDPEKIAYFLQLAYKIYEGEGYLDKAKEYETETDMWKLTPII